MDGDIEPASPSGRGWLTIRGLTYPDSNRRQDQLFGGTPQDIPETASSTNSGDPGVLGWHEGRRAPAAAL